VTHGREVIVVLVGVLALLGCSPSSGEDVVHEHGEVPEVDEGQLAVAVPAFDLAVGEPQRFVVGLFTADQTDIGYGTVELRFRWLGGADETASSEVSWGPPVTAEFRLLPGTATEAGPAEPAVLSTDQGRGVYVTSVSFDHPGFWEVAVTGDIDRTDGDAGTGAFDVLAHHRVPAVGDRALPSDNATLTTADLPASALDSRATTTGDLPDPHMHETTIRAAIERHRPAVVVFSTPTYCLSRFCGPVTDMVADLAEQYSDRAEFIHVEIWEDFDQQRLNPAAEDWLYRDGNLQEPWVFLIGSDGRITARWDNVLIAEDLEAALGALPQEEWVLRGRRPASGVTYRSAMVQPHVQPASRQDLLAADAETGAPRRFTTYAGTVWLAPPPQITGHTGGVRVVASPGVDALDPGTPLRLYLPDSLPYLPGAAAAITATASPLGAVDQTGSDAWLLYPLGAELVADPRGGPSHGLGIEVRGRGRLHALTYQVVVAVAPDDVGEPTST
jgi:hypothetical protein